MELRHRWVHFRIRDVWHPKPEQVLMDLHGNEVLLGKVIDLSDSGRQTEVFVVVEVKGIEQALILPVERLLGIL